MPTIEASATTPASRDAVWNLLADATTWADWGPWSSVTVEGGSAQGPGAVRVLVKRPLTIRERVTTWEPGARMGYELVDGMKVQGYHADVTLHDAPGGGTELRWRSTYDKAGPVTTLILRAAVKDVCKRVAKAAAG